VVEGTAGVRRYQVVPTASDTLTVRLENTPETDRTEVWRRVSEGLSDFLRTHDAAAITLHLAPELPQVNPRNGKLRHVLKMLPPASTTTPAART
jgi:phenylacetate-CoA ligase